MAQSSLLVYSDDGPRRGFLLIAVAMSAPRDLHAQWRLIFPGTGDNRTSGRVCGLQGGGVYAYRSRMADCAVDVDRDLDQDFLPRGRAARGDPLWADRLFCVPCVFPVWRKGIFRRGGFDFIRSISYGRWSPLPIRSRPITRSCGWAIRCWFFAPSAPSLSRSRNPADMTSMIERFLIGCGVFVIIMALVAVGCRAASRGTSRTSSANDNV